jgi:hypothetical protein
VRVLRFSVLIVGEGERDRDIQLSRAAARLFRLSLLRSSLFQSGLFSSG